MNDEHITLKKENKREDGLPLESQVIRENMELRNS